VLVLTLARRVEAELGAALAPLGLTVGRLGLLGHISALPGISFSELARMSGTSVQSVHVAVKALVVGGLARDDSARAGAASRIELTDAGGRLLREAKEVVAGVDRRVFGVEGDPGPAPDRGGGPRRLHGGRRRLTPGAGARSAGPARRRGGPVTGPMTSRIRIGAGGPYAVIVDDDGTAWVTLVHSGQPARVVADGVVELQELGAGSRPSQPAVAADGGSLAVVPRGAGPC
jgi:DNA-binding MarR family transcriptional regulator